MTTAVTETEQALATARPYQICTFCVMDTSDCEIEFDADGRCNHCRSFPAPSPGHSSIRKLPNAATNESLFGTPA